MCGGFFIFGMLSLSWRTGRRCRSVAARASAAARAAPPAPRKKARSPAARRSRRYHGDAAGRGRGGASFGASRSRRRWRARAHARGPHRDVGHLEEHLDALARVAAALRLVVPLEAHGLVEVVEGPAQARDVRLHVALHHAHELAVEPLLGEGELLGVGVELVRAVDLELFEREELVHEVRVEEVEEVLGDEVHELRGGRGVERRRRAALGALGLARRQRRVVVLGLRRRLLQEAVEAHRTSGGATAAARGAPGPRGRRADPGAARKAPLVHL